MEYKQDEPEDHEDVVISYEEYKHYMTGGRLFKFDELCIELAILNKRLALMAVECKCALAALNQNATYSSDINVAKEALTRAKAALTRAISIEDTEQEKI